MPTVGRVRYRRDKCGLEPQRQQETRQSANHFTRKITKPGDSESHAAGGHVGFWDLRKAMPAFRAKRRPSGDRFVLQALHLLHARDRLAVDVISDLELQVLLEWLH